MGMNRILPMQDEVKTVAKRFAEQVTGCQLKDTHICKIRVHAYSDRIHRPVDSSICVGKELDCNLSNIPHEPVTAIFESGREYVVITPNHRDFAAGTVYFFEPSQVMAVERDTE